MAKYPVFRRKRCGLTSFDSDAAKPFDGKKTQWSAPMGLQVIEKAAKDAVKHRGGDVEDRKDVLGMLNIDFCFQCLVLLVT
jgi:hypothetical protein